MPLHATDPGLADVRAALTAREPLFHRAGLGTTRAEAEALTAVDFVEIGASGRVYSREYVLDVVDERDRRGAVEALEPDDVACRELAPGLYQLSYRLVQGERDMAEQLVAAGRRRLAGRLPPGHGRAAVGAKAEFGQVDPCRHRLRSPGGPRRMLAVWIVISPSSACLPTAT